MPNLRYSHLKIFTLGTLFRETYSPILEMKNIKIGLWADNWKLWD